MQQLESYTQLSPFQNQTKITTLDHITDHKLPTHIISINHCQNTRENTFTIRNRKHSSDFSSTWIETYTLNTHCFAQHMPPNQKKSFNNPRPPQRTVAVALDMSKAFDTVNIHKLTLTNIANIITKFIASYKKKTTSMHSIQWHTLKTQRINTGVQQGGVLSPILFNIYPSDIPLPPKDIQITTYADDVTITASYTKHRKGQQLI